MNPLSHLPVSRRTLIVLALVVLCILAIMAMVPASAPAPLRST
jgi:hypothetical protein